MASGKRGALGWNGISISQCFIFMDWGRFVSWLLRDLTFLGTGEKIISETSVRHGTVSELEEM